jgi:hypothetical protein
MNLLRMFLTQTRMNFTWYFQRDGEMIFWTLAMPVFFLVLFSFAFSSGPSTPPSAKSTCFAGSISRRYRLGYSLHRSWLTG